MVFTDRLSFFLDLFLGQSFLWNNSINFQALSAKRHDKLPSECKFYGILRTYNRGANTLKKLFFYPKIKISSQISGYTVGKWWIKIVKNKLRKF